MKYSVIIPVYNRPQEIVECVSSLLRIRRDDFEIIIVDDGSTDETQEILKNLKTTKVKICRNEINRGAAVSRNKGAKLARGDFLFFLDSDTEVDLEIFNALDDVIRYKKKIGMITPIIYYYEDKARIWYAGAWINMLTSQAYYRSINQIDRGKFNKIEVIKGAHVPTALMIPKEIFFKSGMFNESLNMGFEEPFIAKEIEKLGTNIYFSPFAKIYHKIPAMESTKGNIKGKIRDFFTYISFRNPKIAYYTSRNRVWFMKKYSDYYFLFLIFFLPLSIFIYLVKSIFSKKPKYFIQILKGSLVGIFGFKSTHRL